MERSERGAGPGSLEKWFGQYVRDFRTGSAEDIGNIELKEEHTRRVRADAEAIACGLGLEEDERSLASIIALFHDVGRFPQYRQYRTFRDSESVNHAALGARVLVEQQVLRELPPSDRDLIVRAVALHNVFSLPPGLDRRLELHARIVRDADKLDIWRIFAGLFSLPAGARPSAAGLGLPDGPGFSAAVLERLVRREMVPLAEIRGLNDYKLLQLSWIYDLNFPASFRALRERDLIARIASTLPADPALGQALEILQALVGKQCGP